MFLVDKVNIDAFNKAIVPRWQDFDTEHDFIEAMDKLMIHTFRFK
jgi:hypothetical protein